MGFSGTLRVPRPLHIHVSSPAPPPFLARFPYVGVRPLLAGLAAILPSIPNAQPAQSLAAAVREATLDPLPAHAALVSEAATLLVTPGGPESVRERGVGVCACVGVRACVCLRRVAVGLSWWRIRCGARMCVGAATSWWIRRPVVPLIGWGGGG
jgi:hypothetical protein